MSKAYPGDERRKFKRIKLKFTISVIYRKDEPLEVLIRDGVKEYEATMLDISEGGMSVLTNVDIPSLSTLWIRFTLTHAKEECVDFFGTLEIKGEVRYSITIKPGIYRLGICFTSISESDRRQIANFMAMIDR